jgi:hypothetical protein
MRGTTDQSSPKAAAAGTGRQAMYAVAKNLHDFGFGIRLPQDNDSRRLVIVNARNARSEITVDDDGYVTWDYWPWTRAATAPADLAGVALSVLGPAPTGARPIVGGGLTLKGWVGRALRELGLHVTMAVYEDDDAFDVTAEVVATNPDAPFCGLVRVTDEARITWQCPLQGPTTECALAVTDTIVPVLTHGTVGMRQLWADTATH